MGAAGAGEPPHQRDVGAVSLAKHTPCPASTAKVHEYRCVSDRVSKQMREPVLFYCVFCLAIVHANVVVVP